MDDFGMLARDFGYRPQGKSAPMGPSKSNSTGGNLNFGIGSDGGADNTRSSLNRFHSTFNNRSDEVFGGPPNYTSSAADAQGSKGVGSWSGGDECDSLFHGSNSKSSSLPVFDKPVYDDDIFDGLPGVKNLANSSSKYDDVFASMSSPPSKCRATHNDGFDDLESNFGHIETSMSSREKVEKDAPVFDDLLPGFGGRGTPSKRQTSASSRSQKQSSNSTTSSVMEDPFVVLESNSRAADSTSGLFTDPLEEFSKHSSSGKTRQESSSFNEGVFDDIDPFDSPGKSVLPVSSEAKYKPKDRIPGRNGPSMSAARNPSIEPIDKYPIETSDSHERRVPVDNFQESCQTIFDMPNVSTDFHGSVGQTTFSPSYLNIGSAESNSQVYVSPRSEENLKTADDIWLTVLEIPLFTQPTSAPPPSRPPPPRPARASKPGTRPFGSTNTKEKVYEFSSFPSSTQYSYSPKSACAAVSSSGGSQRDELADFAMGRAWNNVNEHENVRSVEEVGTNSDAAAAMKEAMDKAEARFKHAKEIRERDHIKAARSKEDVLKEDEKTMQNNQDKELREKQHTFDHERYKREKEEEEREQRRLEGERERAQEIEREREEKEREQRRREKEREKARQAVERATREARERAATEARLKAEKAAVEKANADREHAERAAVQRAQAEARQRLAVQARERAEKAAAEAREREARERASASRARAEAEARSRAERSAVGRAAAEARERAAAAAAARANQQKNDNDLESFFSMGTRPSSTPKSRTNSSDPLFDTQAQNKGRPEGVRTSVGASSNIRKAASATNIVDDLTSIFGSAPSSAGKFQEVEGESEERRRSRLERHQRTQERAAKALAEKNQRDLQAQRDQAERYRIAETLDVEIKRWSAGKEGNLRALLSTLQYVLWPECGWQPISLTDLITAAAVKKVYRKATLCIHPDKVQQKGANIQQKYIAEKVFDLLKEAWNKFNSEELF